MTSSLAAQYLTPRTLNRTLSVAKIQTITPPIHTRTPALPDGIYVVSVERNGSRQFAKFAVMEK